MLLGFHDSLDMVVVQSMTLVNDCDVMTLVQWNPQSDQCTSHQQCNQRTNGLEKKGTYVSNETAFQDDIFLP
jgi:hypothetical protein